MAQHDEPRAIEWLIRSTEIRPDRPLAEEDLTPYFLLASLAEQRGQRQKMVEYLQAAVERAPRMAKTHYALGVAYQRQSRPIDALPAFARAVELDSDMIDARYRLAAVAAETGDLRRAAEELQTVVDRNPEYEEAAAHLQRIRQMLMQQ